MNRQVKNTSKFYDIVAEIKTISFATEFSN